MKNVRTPILMCLLALGMMGCGFQPVYGTRSDNASVAQQINAVGIENIPNRDGQMLRNNLIDRLYRKGRPSAPLYNLSINLRRTEDDLGIQADSTSTRSLLNIYADYALKNKKGDVLVKGTARSVASFNKQTQQYSTESARQSAIERTMVEVSDQIVNTISLYFSEKASLSALSPSPLP